MNELNPTSKFHTIRKGFKKQRSINACPNCGTHLFIYLTPKARAVRFAECPKCDYVILVPKPKSKKTTESPATPQELPGIPPPQPPRDP